MLGASGSALLLAPITKHLTPITFQAMSSLSITRDSGVAVLSLDVANAPVNTLSLALADEMRVVFDELERDSSIGAAV